MFESLEFEFRLGSAMAEAESLLTCELNPCRLELRDGGGVCIDPELSPRGLFLPVTKLPSVCESVVLVDSRASDEESCLDDSTGGNVRTGSGEK